MVEMQMENELLQQVGEEWIRAITEGALERLEGFCHPDVMSHLMTPKRYMAIDNATDLAAKFRQWFGACSDFQVERSRVERVGERLGVFYRLRFLQQGTWYVAEQQLYCTLQEDRIVRLHLLCSGFQPVEQTALAEEDEEILPGGDALLVFHTGAVKNESTCAVLTPAIKAKLREMQSGQVLEIRVDDPSAREDIEAWCRLSGNLLLRMSEGTEPELRFFVRKK